MPSWFVRSPSSQDLENLEKLRLSFSVVSARAITHEATRSQKGQTPDSLRFVCFPGQKQRQTGPSWSLGFVFRLGFPKRDEPQKDRKQLATQPRVRSNIMVKAPKLWVLVLHLLRNLYRTSDRDGPWAKVYATKTEFIPKPESDYIEAMNSGIGLQWLQSPTRSLWPEPISFLCKHHPHKLAHFQLVYPSLETAV